MFYDQSQYYEMPAAFRNHKAQVAYDDDVSVDSYYRAQQIPNAPAVQDADRLAPALYAHLDTGFGHHSVTHQQYNIPPDTPERATFGSPNVAVSLPKQLAPAASVPAADEGQALSGGGVIDITALQSKTKNDGKPAAPPVDHDSLTALVNARERDVKRLLATLATPLANWNAKFIWHCIMKLPGACDAIFAQKVKEVHKAFYVPPAISFYALWLHFRFWNMSPKLYFTIENRLPATFGAGLGKEARISVFMYYLAVLFANKHLDDFSYRNSSWYEAAGVPAADFLQFELVALGELKWSLEITSDEWINWIDYLQSSNTQLECTAPIHQSYHWAVGNALYEALVAMRLLRSSGSTYSGSSAGSASRASSTSASPQLPPHTSEIPELHQYRQPTVQPAPVKHIPWDTSEDPVVVMRSHRRSSSLTSLSSASGHVGNMTGSVSSIWDANCAPVNGRMSQLDERGAGALDLRRRGHPASSGFAAPRIEGLCITGKGTARPTMHGRTLSSSAANPLKSCNEYVVANWAMTL